MERFADESDRASALEQAERDHLINKARTKKIVVLKAIGYCHYCNDETPLPLLFCDDDCAIDYRLMMSARCRNGYN